MDELDAFEDAGDGCREGTPWVLTGEIPGLFRPSCARWCICRLRAEPLRVVEALAKAGLEHCPIRWHMARVGEMVGAFAGGEGVGDLAGGLPECLDGKDDGSPEALSLAPAATLPA